MHPREEREAVRRLLTEGLNDCAVARRTGIPRSTVRQWRVGIVPPRWVGRTCADCGAAAHEPEDLPAAAYAYLLGQYLGDGHIVHHHRGVYSLRIFLDLLHLNIAETCRRAIEDVLPGAHVAYDCPRSARMVVVRCASKQWPCLLPQHGPGKKHERKIELVGWQQRIVDGHPDQLVRGLLHSDGWRGTNNVTVGGKRYAYPRYQFAQTSTDIQRSFTDALDQLGVSWRQMGPKDISIARKADVAALDAFVERKS